MEKVTTEVVQASASATKDDIDEEDSDYVPGDESPLEEDEAGIEINKKYVEYKKKMKQGWLRGVE